MKGEKDMLFSSAHIHVKLLTDGQNSQAHQFSLEVDEKVNSAFCVYLFPAYPFVKRVNMRIMWINS